MDPQTQNQNNNHNNFGNQNQNPNYDAAGFNNAGAGGNPYYPQQDSNQNQNQNQYQNQENQNLYQENQNPYTEPIIPNKDVENNNEDGENLDGYKDEITKEIRIGFIKKVYGILSAQLLFTVGLICLTFKKSFHDFLLNNLPIFYVCCGVSIVIAITLICFKKVARKTPLNYILLGIWTFCEAWMVAVIAATYEPYSVLVAGVLTAAVTCALTYYACTTKTDFTFCGGMLFAGSMIMFVMGIFFLIFGINRSGCPLLNILYCGFGVCLYSMYLIFDTQLVMGKFGNEYSIDDYIVAAMIIYIDIIQMFLYILEMFGSSR